MPSKTLTFEPKLDHELVEEVALEWWLKSARRLAKRRTSFGLTQGHIAHACGVTPQCISQIESGVRRPSEPLRWILADALGCNTEDIWEPMTREELARRCANFVTGAA